MIGFLGSRRHSRLRGLLSSYIDDRVSDAEARQVQQHVSACEDCRSELDSLRGTVGLLRTLPQLEASRSFALTEEPAPVGPSRHTPWAAALATSVAGLLLVALLLGDVLGILTQSGASKPSLAELVAPEAAPAPAPAPAPAAAAAPAPAPVRAPAAAAAPAPASAAPAPVPVPAPAAALESAAAPAPAAPAPAAAMAAPAPPARAPRLEQALAAAEELTPQTQPEEKVAPQAVQDRDILTPEAERPTDRDSAEVAEPPAERAAPPRGPAATPVAVAEHLMTERTITDERNELREAPRGLILPLWQLEVGAGLVFVVLALAALWTARRGRRR